MSEPTASSAVTVGLFAMAGAVLGPMLGPVMLIVITSSVGAYIAAAEAHTESVRDVIIFVLRGALFALVLATIVSDWIEPKFGLAGHSAVAGASVFIGYYAHRFRDVIEFARRFIPGNKGGPSDAN